MVQIQVITKILYEGYDKWVLGYDLDESYFSDYKEEFNYIKEFYDKYDTTVDPVTFVNKFQNFETCSCSDPDQALISRLRYDLRYRMMAEVFNKLRDSAASVHTYEDERLANDIVNSYHELGNIITKTSVTSYRTEEECINELKEKFIHTQKHRDDIFIPTGLDGLEDLHGWDKESDYVIVAGRPSAGKSYILCKFALEAAKQGLNVGYITLEMPWHQIDHRITAMLTNMSIYSLDKGYESVTQEYMDFLENERPKYHIHYADINDFSGKPTVSKIESFCIKKKLDIVFIDQMSFIKPEGRMKEDYRDASIVSRNIKIMRDKLNIPVIVANQLNRTKTQDQNADLVQLAGSDVIGQDATKVIVVEKIEEENEDVITKLTIVKNRSGKAFGKVKLIIDFDKGIFNRAEEVVKDEETEAEVNIFGGII